MTTTSFLSISRLAKGTPVTLTDFRPIPNFKFMPPRVTNHGIGSIAMGDGFLHEIDDIEKFYAALGFKHIGGGGLLPEEFIWDRYIRGGASKSTSCLQTQIAHYLYNHSARFKELYGCAHEKMMGTCKLAQINDRDDHCLNCPMHPILRH